jgi:N,N'-diacetyllegionaminate synthase
MGVKIIAEAGSNHNGSLELAYNLIDIALLSEADFVKFQIIDTENLYVPYYWDGKNQIENKVYERRLKEELTFDDWKKVHAYAEEKGIPFTASVFSTQGVDFLHEIGVPFIKLASSDLNNLSLVEYIAKKNIPLVISTGMASLEEIEETCKTYLNFGEIQNLTILHCVSVYPCSLENTNLSKITALKSNFNCEIGFSDHTLSSHAACASIALGAKIIEKHFTIDKSLDGFDHLYASNPEEFKSYINEIRAIERSIQSSVNSDSSVDSITKVRARRGIYFNKPMIKGDIVKIEDIVFLRPSTKLSPPDLVDVIGKEIGENVRAFEAFILEKERIIPDTTQTWKSANSFWVNEMKEKKIEN